MFSDRARVRRRGRATRQGGHRGRPLPEPAGRGLSRHRPRVGDAAAACCASRRHRSSASARRSRRRPSCWTRWTPSTIAWSRSRTGAPSRTGRSGSSVRSARPRRCPRTSARAGRTSSSTRRLGGRRSTSSACARAVPASACVKIDSDQREAIKERARIVADVQALNQGGFSDRVVDVVAIVDGRAVRAGRRAGAGVLRARRRAGSRPTTFTTRRRAGRSASRRRRSSSRRPARTGPTPSCCCRRRCPGRGIDLPELLTWTLGEQSEFVPAAAPAPRAAGRDAAAGSGGAIERHGCRRARRRAGPRAPRAGDRHRGRRRPVPRAAGGSPEERGDLPGAVAPGAPAQGDAG